jgi:hypothetical protein
MVNILNELYPNRFTIPLGLNDIPNKGYMVYILTHNNKPIVLGHGQKNRSKVIFDDEINITSGHLKALFVRLYYLYGNGIFNRFIISCNNKEEARTVERHLHQIIGGNKRIIPSDIRNKLFDGIEPNSTSHLVLEIALRSSFDGLSDIRKWRTDGILNETIWRDISKRLKL